MKDALLAAAMATHIPEGYSGPWSITRVRLSKDFDVPVPAGGWIHGKPKGKSFVLPAGAYTNLWRKTEATMHTYGELVMHDTPQELQTHLNFMLRARGTVLITGLGLGCVARGCLANPAVEHVTIIERDPDVLKLVRPYMPEGPRLTIIQADALQWTKQNTQTFSCAWHDLWSDPDAGEPHLQVMHSELLLNCVEIKTQGAWAFPRFEKTLWRRLAPMQIV